MNAVVEKKPCRTTSAVIASITGEGQRVKAAPFGKALVALAEKQPKIVGLTADLAKYTGLRLLNRHGFAWNLRSTAEGCDLKL